MKVFLTILKKQGLAVTILIGSFLGVRWIVSEFRPPGAMTVIEAQAMDMKAMKAPIGVVPVGIEYVLERTLGGTETFPATIVALSDEDVVARVPGLISEILVYPGDRVRAGQLLARIDADEFDAMALASVLTADAKQGQAQAARDDFQRQQLLLRKSEIDVEAYEASVEAAKAGLRAADHDVSSADDKVREVAAKGAAASAELDYARADFGREQELYDGGAISRDDLDKAKKRIETAQAKVDQVDAQRSQSQSGVGASRAKRDASRSMLTQAKARLEGSKEAVGVSRAMVSASRSNLTAKESEFAAMRAASGAAGALSSYTELRAADDGVVTERLVSPGTPVMPGRAILRIKVDREVRVQADLPQRLANYVQVGSTVRISYQDQSADAQVTSVFPFVDGRTRTFRIESKIPNDGAEWQVGSFAEMEVATSEAKKVLSIRNEAVKKGTDGSYYVWLLVGEQTGIAADAIYTCTMHPEEQHVGPGDCSICNMPLVPVDATGNVRAEKRPVSVGPSSARYTAILDGLVEGDTVTWAGDAQLFPGAAVQAVEWDENGPLELPAGAGVMLHDGEEMSFDEHENMDMGDDGDEGMDMGDDGDMDMGGGEVGDASTMAGHEGHDHGPDDNFTCPMHPDVHKSEAGICPICKMDLVPIEDGS